MFDEFWSRRTEVSTQGTDNHISKRYAYILLDIGGNNDKIGGGDGCDSGTVINMYICICYYHRHYRI